MTNTWSKTKIMKRSLLAAALFVSATSANALDLKRSGYWTAFLSGTKQTPICGMSTNFGDGTNRMLMIKYIAGQGHLTGHIIKPNWRFPTEGVGVPLTIGVDKNPILSGQARGYINENMPMIEFYVTPEKADLNQFLIDFAKAARFWVRFDEGDEKPWVLDMAGSAEVTQTFRTCTMRLLDAGNTSQPYGRPPATQPYGGNKPAQPAQPTQPVKPNPAQVSRQQPRDDGGI